MISTLTILFYCSAAGLMARHLAKGAQRLPHQKYLAILLSLSGLTAHLMVLSHTLITMHGINLSLSSAFSLIAWIIILTWHGLLLLQQAVEFLAILILPIAALAVFWAEYYPAVHVLTHLSAGLQAHIVLALLAYSLLSLAAVQAILLAIQDYYLHHHRPAGFIRAFPPLQTMEKILFKIIYAGFIILTLALLLGLGFIHDLMAQHLAHKTVLSTLAWVMFAILLLGHWKLGWRSQLAIYWTLGGLFTLLLAYFGSKFVLEILLQRV